jgi:hypothetical protein
VNPKPVLLPDRGTSPSRRQQARPAQRPAGCRPRVLLLLTPHAIRATPWVTVISGCLSGTAILGIFAYVAHEYHSALGPAAVRFCFLPAIATLAFIPRTLFRPLTQATPVPAWLTAAIQTFLAFAVLALTCWAQLGLMASTIPDHPAGPAVYPLIAELACWSAIFVAAAACCDRSRFADVGGAMAVPIGVAVIALAWYTPGLKDIFVTPPATPRAATIAWYIVAAAALAVAYLAMRDKWRRYTRLAVRVRSDSATTS